MNTESGKIKLMYFGPEMLELNKEVRNHPKLTQRLVKMNALDFETKIASVAAYCGVALDGAYDEEDLENIAKLCLAELRKKSTIIITH